MGLLSGFQDGFLFTSGRYFLYQGAYTGVPELPCVCDKCIGVKDVKKRRDLKQHDQFSTSKQAFYDQRRTLRIGHEATYEESTDILNLVLFKL